MNRTGKFITAAELETVQVAVKTSGMFLSGGASIGDPEAEVERLVVKYGMHGCALDSSVGEFVRVEP